MSDWPPEFVEKVRSTLSKRDVFPIYDSFTESDACRLLDAIADDVVLKRDYDELFDRFDEALAGWNDLLCAVDETNRVIADAHG